VSHAVSRRELLAGGAAGLGAALLPAPARPAAEPEATGFRYCLNTALLRGYRLDVVEQVRLAGEAGYDGIEPWVEDVVRYRDAGGSLADLASRIANLGLTVESAIGFAPWIVDDHGERAKGLEQARREMDLVRAIGGRRIAAPPAGAVEGAPLELRAIAQRYRALLEVGAEVGVVPELEVWGFARNVSRLSEAAFVAIEADHPDACLLLDVYHLYKGGSAHEGLRLLGPHAVPVLHTNDYPAIPRERIADADRVLPGEGVAPLGEILRTLRGILGLERMRAAVAAIA